MIETQTIKIIVQVIDKILLLRGGWFQIFNGKYCFTHEFYFL